MAETIVKVSPSPTPNVEPDWSREHCQRGWDPPRRMLAALRQYQRWRERRSIIARGICKWCVLKHRFWSVVSGCDIPLNSRIGGGLLLLHPIGIVIHPSATIGVNCLILQQVTIAGGVQIGTGVVVGAGARLIAPVRIGAYAKIGANAVVLQDVPAGATAVGVPARIILHTPEHDSDETKDY